MQIHIAPEDQHNTALTCPSNIITLAYSQYFIFSYLIKSCLQVFMDNSTVHLSSFPTCLHYLLLLVIKVVVFELYTHICIS